MRFFINLLPLILIVIILVVFINQLIPEYKKTIELAQKLNELNNKERDLNELENIVNQLKGERAISSLMARKETLEAWLPREPKIKEIIFFFHTTYQELGLGIFPGANFNIEKKEKYLINTNILPVGTINFSLSFENVDLSKIQEFISAIEKSTRFMKINKLNLNLGEKGGLKSEIEVESYYLITSPKEEKNE